MNIDLEELAAVIRLIREAEFSEFSYAKGDVSLTVRRGELVAQSDAVTAAPPARTADAVPAATTTTQAAPPAQAASPAPNDPNVPAVRAPLLGTFYSAPKPGEPPFVQPGDRVEPETVVCIIEVMKLMNSVTAGISGTVAAIHVGDGDLVEHEQVLFSIEPDA